MTHTFEPTGPPSANFLASASVTPVTCRGCGLQAYEQRYWHRGYVTVTNENSWRVDDACPTPVAPESTPPAPPAKPRTASLATGPHGGHWDMNDYWNERAEDMP